MARRRMFSQDVCFADRFLELPSSAQALYFFMGIYADDDGFVINPKTIARMCGASESDLSTLVENDYLIHFSTGVYVITDWNVHNYIQKDRYRETACVNEKRSLILGEDRRYTKSVSMMDTDCKQSGYTLEAQDSIAQTSLAQTSLAQTSPAQTSPDKTRGGTNNATARVDRPTVEDALAFAVSEGLRIDARLIEKIAQRGWRNNDGSDILDWKEHLRDISAFMRKG